MQLYTSQLLGVASQNKIESLWSVTASHLPIHSNQLPIHAMWLVASSGVAWEKVGVASHQKGVWSTKYGCGP